MTIDVLQIPALSIRPPWAQLILGGWKPCENRTWTTEYRGPVIIHAGQKYDTPPDDIAKDLAAIHPATECPGVCDIWGEDGDEVFHWVMQAPQPFAASIPGPGRLGLYRKGIPAEVHTALSEVVAS